MWADEREFPFSDMTAVEMARFLGFSDLVDILSPIIRHSIPSQTLNVLETNFHGIIRKDLGDIVAGKRLRLPSLTILTELEVPELWFPVRVIGNGGTKVIPLLD
jgi:hypothetical protein